MGKVDIKWELKVYWVIKKTEEETGGFFVEQESFLEENYIKNWNLKDKNLSGKLASQLGEVAILTNRILLWCQSEFLLPCKKEEF